MVRLRNSACLGWIWMEIGHGGASGYSLWHLLVAWRLRLIVFGREGWDGILMLCIERRLRIRAWCFLLLIVIIMG
jgi:hypothetical protein